MSDVLAIDTYTNNGYLIEAADTLGYIGERVLDLSYGRGLFWSRIRPVGLTTNDLSRAIGIYTQYHRDATDWDSVALWRSWWDTVVWDPPYRLNGTPDQEGFDERYGIAEPTTVAERMHVILSGSANAVRCTKPGGYTLVKCQNQVVSGRKVDQVRQVKEACEEAGSEWIDDLHYLTPVRPQPPGRRQVHARSNYSTLVVMRRTKR